MRWGVLGAANIAVRAVIPALQRSQSSTVVAIASRTVAKARTAADATGVERAYGSYEALLDDPEIEAVYIPLPNHLHVPWAIRAADAGKHVLCEKPIALNAAEARTLLAARDRTGVQIAEAFMVRSQPRWHAVREMVREGRIGELKVVAAHFSYSRRDPGDVRSRVEWGGGALLDIGCYPVMLSRWLFGAEPVEVMAALERDPELKIDRLGSAVLRFANGQATFTCAGQLVPWQRMQLFGSRGRIDVPIPFNIRGTDVSRVFVDDGRDLQGTGIETIEFAAADQYLEQVDQFAAAVRGLGAVPMPLEDSVANMAVLDALFRSAASGRWEAMV